MKKILAGMALGCALLGCAGVEAAMTYEEAAAYQKSHAEDIVARSEKIRNPYGEKTKSRIFSFLGKNGVSHNWGSIGTHYTLINLILNYGDKKLAEAPYAYLRWHMNIDGNPKNGFEPRYMSVSFTDGYIKNLELQGWDYAEGNVYIPGATYDNGYGYSYQTPGTSYVYNQYDGSVKVGELDLYEMAQHGEIASIYIAPNSNDDKGNNTTQHFFYTGDKDKEEKAQLARGFQHALTMLEIDEAHLQQLREEAEKERLAKLRKEIEAELEREALKAQILKERAVAGK